MPLIQDLVDIVAERSLRAAGQLVDVMLVVSLCQTVLSGLVSFVPAWDNSWILTS